MAGNDAGTAFIDILPRVNQFGSQLQRQVQAESAKAGQKAGGAFGAAFGPEVGRTLVKTGLGVTAVGVALTRMGEESRQATRQLSTAVENAGQSFEAFEPQIDAVSKRLVRLGFDDEATARSLATLTTATQDTGKSIDRMSLAADIAAARHISLESAADKLAKAQSGNTRIFKEFGIEVSQGATATERAAAMTELQSRVQGQAEGQADSFTGKLKSLRIQAENVAEALGEKAGPAITLLGPLIAGVGGIIQSRAVPSLVNYVRTLYATRVAQEVVGDAAVVMGGKVAASNAGMVAGQGAAKGLSGSLAGVAAGGGLAAGSLTVAAAVGVSFLAKWTTTALGLQKAMKAIGIPAWMRTGFNFTVFGPVVGIVDLLTRKNKETAESTKELSTAFQDTAATLNTDYIPAVQAAIDKQDDAAASTDAMSTAAERGMARFNAAAKARSDAAAKLAKDLDLSFAGTATKAQLSERFSEAQADALGKVADAEQAYGDVQQRVSDEVVARKEQATERLVAATERVAEAEQRAAEQREDAADRVADAEQRLADVKERQSASATTGSNPIKERLIARRQELRDANQAVEEARKDQADTEAQAAADVAKARQGAVDAERELQDASQVTAGQRKELEQAERELQDARNAAARDLAVAIQDHVRGLISIGATMDEVRGAFDGHIDDFRRVATQMGLNEEQAQALIDKYGLVPETVHTVVELVGANETIAEAQRVSDELVLKFGIAEQAAKITVEVFGTENALNALTQFSQDASVIASTFVGPLVPPGGLGSTSSPSSPGAAPRYPSGLGSGIPGRAAGGPVWPGASFTVGEKGTERLDLSPSGHGYVTPLTNSTGGIGGAPITIVVNAYGIQQVEMPHKIAREVRREMFLSGR